MNASADDSSSDDGSDVVVQVRQRQTASSIKATNDQRTGANVQRSATATDPSSKASQTRNPSSAKSDYSNNNATNSDSKWEMSSDSEDDSQSETSSTRSTNDAEDDSDDGSRIKVSESDIADFMLLMPDYAYGDPETDAARNFRRDRKSVV